MATDQDPHAGPDIVAPGRDLVTGQFNGAEQFDNIGFRMDFDRKAISQALKPSPRSLCVIPSYRSGRLQIRLTIVQCVTKEV